MTAAIAVFLTACGGGGAKEVAPAETSDRPARTFLLGVSSLPADSGEDAYRDAFKLADRAGELVLIQRAPPWSDFVPGATISDRTERLTRLEKDLAKENNLKLFLAVDPTEPSDRGRLAGLPDDLRGKDFSDSRIRAAFIGYAKYLALNYRPAYMALGVEVDMFYDRRGDGAFRNLLSLYFEAYNAVKSVSSGTLVFPTFQYENMLGLLHSSEGTQAAWVLVSRFEPKIDLLAVSSFPGMVFESPEAMPEFYYSALNNRTDHPIGFASIGWSSSKGAGQDSQYSFMSRTLAAADSLKASMLVWYLGRDPRAQPSTAFQPLSAMGLFDADGIEKTSWSLWRRQLERPTAP